MSATDDILDLLASRRFNARLMVAVTEAAADIGAEVAPAPTVAESPAHLSWQRRQMLAQRAVIDPTGRAALLRAGLARATGRGTA